MIWDVTTSKETRTLYGHSSGIGSIAFSRDGKLLATGSGGQAHPGELKVWDLKDGREL
jgi:WD40 repeat protein